MSATLIIGESGTGKSASMRNLDTQKTLLIQSIKKPLPFKSTAWVRHEKGSKDPFSVYTTDNADHIIKALNSTSKEIVIIDDFQYVMSNEFMRRSSERGFDKFTDIGRRAWDIINAAVNSDKRVYILSHLEESDSGRQKMKTIGRMLDEKVVLEGFFTTVLKTVVQDGKYQFSTKNNGNDTVKSPIGLFDADLIDNDLQFVDSQICEYFGL